MKKKEIESYMSRISVPTDKLREREQFVFAKIRKKQTWKYKMRRVLLAATVVLSATTAIESTVPGFAGPLTLAGAILEYFHLGHAEPFTVTGQVQENQGITISIQKSIYDGSLLVVSYTVKSEKPFTEKPKIIDVAGQIKTDHNLNKIYYRDEYGTFVDDTHTTYEGAMTFQLNKGSFQTEPPLYEKKDQFLNANRLDFTSIPKSFEVVLPVTKLGSEKGIRGKWNFTLQIDSVKAKEKMKLIPIQRNFPQLQTKVDSMLLTPVRLYLQGSGTEESALMRYLAVTNTGQVLHAVEEKSLILDDETQTLIEGFETPNYAKSVRFIPYNYAKREERATRPKIPLYIEKETKVPISATQNLIITKVKEENGKTFVFYHASVPLDDFMPFVLVDEDNEEYIRNKEESKTRAKIGEENVLVFDATLKNKKIFVVNPNTMYYNEAFTVQLPKEK